MDQPIKTQKANKNDSKGKKLKQTKSRNDCSLIPANAYLPHDYELIATKPFSSIVERSHHTTPKKRKLIEIDNGNMDKDKSIVDECPENDVSVKRTDMTKTQFIQKQNKFREMPEPTFLPVKKQEIVQRKKISIQDVPDLYAVAVKPQKHLPSAAAPSCRNITHHELTNRNCTTVMPTSLTNLHLLLSGQRTSLTQGLEQSRRQLMALMANSARQPL